MTLTILNKLSSCIVTAAFIQGAVSVLISQCFLFTLAANATGELSREKLLLSPPSGWNLIQHNENTSIRLTEYVPPDSDASNWTEILTIEAFTQQPLPDPIQLLNSIAETQETACDKFTGLSTFSGYENGYPTSVQLFNCDKDQLTQMHQISLIKTIQGTEHFYVISRLMRLGEQQSKISEDRISQAIGRWSAYLGAVSLCDSESSDHPCPITPILEQ